MSLSQVDTFVEGFWNFLTRTLLESTEKKCGWTNNPAKHKENGRGILVKMLVRSENYEKSENRVISKSKV